MIGSRLSVAKETAVRESGLRSKMKTRVYDKGPIMGT